MNVGPYAIPGLKTPEEIAADIWGIPVKLLQIHTRNRDVVECRQVLLNRLKEVTDLSLVAIGAKYGVDRNTVKHACKTVANLKENNEEFKRKYDLFIRCVR
jgi:chromosomal replication initiator protein